MIPKCSLNGYSTYLQLIGIVAMIFILFIVVYYYLQVAHANIIEKYSTGSINLNTIEYKTPSSGDRSTYPEDKYPGGKLENVKSLDSTNAQNAINVTGTLGSTNNTNAKLDAYTLRPCRVYFDSNTKACDDNQDPKKTCSYTFDGWQEFATYTDKYSSNITYPKKIYTGTSTNTEDLINSYFTSKCFKEFSDNGSGGARQFEYNENSLVRFDSKGATDNTQRDTNIFGGKKYTSIQFLNTGNHGDNFDKIIDSVCSVKYNTIRALEGKRFYKIILNNSDEITAVHKVSLNANQNAFTTDSTSAAADFAILGSHGLRFDGDKLQIFIKQTNITVKLKIFTFKYLTNICTTSQIKEYASFDKNITVSGFLTFGTRLESDPKIKTFSNIPNLSLLSASSYNGEGIDYKNEILEDLDAKRKKILKDLDDASEKRKDGYRSTISSLDTDINRANNRRNNFTYGNNRFLDVLGIEYRNVADNNKSTVVFPYKKGYTNNVVGSFDIPAGVVLNCYNSSDIFFTFHNRENYAQKEYSFTIPAGKSYTCDILVVGGGGSGGCYSGGGGGGGDVKTQNNITFGAGTHRIIVGGGGNYRWWTNGGNGNSSSIILSNNSGTYTSGGGGGGSSYYESTPSVQIVDSSWGRSSGGGGGGNNLFGKYYEEIYRYWGYTWWGSTEPGGAKGNNISGNGGNGSQFNTGNWTAAGGGGGGGGGNKSSSGRGEEGSGARGGNGGTGTSVDFYGTGSVNYGTGGGGGIVYNTSGNTVNSRGNLDGTGRGGSSWHSYSQSISGINSTGGGGGGGGYDGHYQGGNGGSGIVVIKVKELAKNVSLDLPKVTTSSTDGYYKPPETTQTTSTNNAASGGTASSSASSSTVSSIIIPSSKAQTCVLTAFVYLQAGYYRFRADIGNTTLEGHPNIIKAELGIYDQSNLKAGTADYTPRTVFKCYNNIPTHLKSYLYIETSKFYKIAYSYIAYNINDGFNLYYKYSSSEPKLESSNIITNPNVNTIDITSGGTKYKYLEFKYTRDTAGYSGQTAYTIKTSSSMTIDLLMVAGGGAGGTDGGGGGGGDVIYKTGFSLPSGTHTILVGNGGLSPGDWSAPGNNGNDTVLITNSSGSGSSAKKVYTSYGGGGGAGWGGYGATPNGRSGPSGWPGETSSGGGGGAWSGGNGSSYAEGGSGNGVSGNGGSKWTSGNYSAGGGGGAVGNGGNGTQNNSGDGGNGLVISFPNPSNQVGYGGGGGSQGRGRGAERTRGRGTHGGGDGGGNGSAGTDGTGGGGGGGNYSRGFKGGSGILIIRYGDSSGGTSSKLPASITIRDAGDYNADSNYDINGLEGITTSMNNYLFYGNTLYDHYTDKEITKIFSTINYDNTNNTSKAFKNLADYLYKDAIDYFDVLKFNNRKKKEQAKIDGEPEVLRVSIEENTDLNNVKGLIKYIKGIDYRTELPISDPVLMSNINYSTIFNTNGDTTDYITHDTLTATVVGNRNISGAALGKGVYIEAFNLTA